MATANHHKYRAIANRMINKHGRLITLINDVGPANVANPLGSPGTPLEVSNIMGVFVRPSGYIKLGESFYMETGMWEEAEKIVLVLPSLVYDFAKFTRIRDSNGMGYKIFKVEELRPGNVPILVYLGLRQ